MMIPRRPARRGRPTFGNSPRWGRTAVEAAIVINMVLMLVLGVCEYGRLVMIKHLADNAAREGARLAVVNTLSTSTVTASQIQSTVTSLLMGQTMSNLVVQVYVADPVSGASLDSNFKNAPFGTDIAVQVDFDVPAIVPVKLGILPNTIHVTAKSLMRSEAN